MDGCMLKVILKQCMTVDGWFYVVLNHCMTVDGWLYVQSCFKALQDSRWMDVCSKLF